MPFAVYFSIYKKRLMKRELKDKKIVIRVTETQYKKLVESILEDDKSISQFIREAIREKIK
jgi:predicted HicB family RNase H-like nuclease